MLVRRKKYLPWVSEPHGPLGQRWLALQLPRRLSVDKLLLLFLWQRLVGARRCGSSLQGQLLRLQGVLVPPLRALRCWRPLDIR